MDLSGSLELRHIKHRHCMNKWTFTSPNWAVLRFRDSGPLLTNYISCCLKKTYPRGVMNSWWLNLDFFPLPLHCVCVRVCVWVKAGPLSRPCVEGHTDDSDLLLDVFLQKTKLRFSAFTLKTTNTSTKQLQPSHSVADKLGLQVDLILLDS